MVIKWARELGITNYWLKVERNLMNVTKKSVWLFPLKKKIVNFVGKCIGDFMNFVGIINSFSGDHYFLSNFHPSYVEYEGLIYPTVEHAFQAAKTLDMEKRKEFTKMVTPDIAMYQGHRLALRSDWEEVKIGIMYHLCKDKFSRTPNKEKLLLTGNAMLIEGNNWHDNYWGSCCCAACGGNGENVLGRILMQIRSEMKGNT